jgi:hypothetical protein
LQGLFTGGFAKTATTLRTAGGAACWEGPKGPWSPIGQFSDKVDDGVPLRTDERFHDRIIRTDPEMQAQRTLLLRYILVKEVLSIDYRLGARSIFWSSVIIYVE